MRYLACAALALLVVGAPASAKKSPQAEIDEELSGKVLTGEERCLDLRNAKNLRIVGTTTVLARNGGKTYRNDPAGGCPEQTMRLRLFTGNDRGQRLCIGDAVTLIDMERDEPAGACRIGMWKVYRRAD